MDIELLGAILRREKETGSLQELPVGFCEDVRNYLESLEAEKKGADGRWSEHVEDEIRSARMKVEDIISRRVGKIVKLASSGMRTPPKGMLEEEERLFEDVRDHVEEGKKRLFALMLGEKGGEEEKEPSWHKTDAEPLPPRDEELHIVRILEDIPTFMGTDGRIYRVKREDVIMLPKTNAEILCKRGVAERFEGKVERR
ncbi:MAG: DNA replication complex subunit Gins51 [Candidatus Methanospirareceae archaeon]